MLRINNIIIILVIVHLFLLNCDRVQRMGFYKDQYCCLRQQRRIGERRSSRATIFTAMASREVQILLAFHVGHVAGDRRASCRRFTRYGLTATIHRRNRSFYDFDRTVFIEHRTVPVSR